MMAFRDVRSRFLPPSYPSRIDIRIMFKASTLSPCIPRNLHVFPNPANRPHCCLCMHSLLLHVYGVSLCMECERRTDPGPAFFLHPYHMHSTIHSQAQHSASILGEGKHGQPSPCV